MPDFYWVGALICETVVNLWSKGGRYKIEDFLPMIRDGKPKRKQTPEQMVAAFKAATRQ